MGTAVLGFTEARPLSKAHHPLRAPGVAELQGPAWRAHLEVGVPCTGDQAPQVQMGLICWCLPQSPQLICNFPPTSALILPLESVQSLQSRWPSRLRPPVT